MELTKLPLAKVEVRQMSLKYMTQSQVEVRQVSEVEVEPPLEQPLMVRGSKTAAIFEKIEPRQLASKTMKQV